MSKREWVLPLKTLIINDGLGLSAWLRQDREDETHVIEKSAYDDLKEVTDIRRENSEREIGRMNNLLYEANRSRDALKESCDELVELIRQATDGQTRSLVTPWRARAIEALASHEKRMKGFK